MQPDDWRCPRCGVGHLNFLAFLDREKKRPIQAVYQCDNPVCGAKDLLENFAWVRVPVNT